MPRKPKKEKFTITLTINNKLITVIMHPPTAKFKTWYAYWTGAVFKRSTGQTDIQEAIKAVEAMLRNGGQRSSVDAALLTDEEFEMLQRRHFERKTDPAARARAAKTLHECLDAIAAFKAIMNLDRVALATPGDCARFQTYALKKPVNWRDDRRTMNQTDGDLSIPTLKRRPSKTQKRRELAGVSELPVETISPNTVLKWSRMLQAAFQRANRNAGKRCVWDVVSEEKLLTTNPWTQFTWIEGTVAPIRQFDAAELIDFMDYLEQGWPDVPVAALAVRVLLWSCCRKLEVAGLTWDMLRLVKEEVHFEVVGKWGVERWFRIPDELYRELLAYRNQSPFVFASYIEQIRRLHADNRGCLRKIREEFAPRNFGRWIYERVKDWAVLHAKSNAYVHVFRKTGLQFAHDGEEEEVSRKVAADAGVSEKVLLGHYVKPKLWRQSNRTYRRLLNSLPPDVARRYGYVEDERTRIERDLEAAQTAGNWPLVAELAARLSGMPSAAQGKAS